jgi:glycosyltransferase involved in cell wall biosynthesis
LEKKRICLVTSGHPSFDERIFWKFGTTLAENNYDVLIISSVENLCADKNGIKINSFDGSNLNKRDKLNKFYELIKCFNPEIIICSEMLTVYSTLKFRKIVKTTKIIYDITEWYPENVTFKFKGIKRWFNYLILFVGNIIAVNKVSHIIVGEISKKMRYDFFAPFKTKTIIGYYPVLKYFNYKLPDLKKEEITLGYAGVITFERGILSLLFIAIEIAKKYQFKKFILLLFGKFTYPEEEKYFREQVDRQVYIKVQFEHWTDYNKMSAVIEKMDLCFDLRERNFVYKNSLPIKLFEYMACGKPFLYTDIKPIRTELTHIDCGFLVNPNNLDVIIEIIGKYLSTPVLINEHSANARKMIEKERSWEIESVKLLDLIESLLSTK